METYKVKSVTVSKKPGGKEDSHRTAFIGLFDVNNPHLKAKAPFKVLNLKNIEKVRVRDLRNVSFYLVGNDLVINNLIELTIDVQDHVATLTGKQDLPN
tara:strand:- start:177 stop:473 length:297 start_codon:yes stop_codon:yes gene_type:complete